MDHNRNFFLTSGLFRKDKIAWECNNGGQLWPGSVVPGVTPPAPLPGTFCTTGFSSLYSAFFVGVLVDLVCQASPSQSCISLQPIIISVLAGLHVFHDVAVLEADGALQNRE